MGNLLLARCGGEVATVAAPWVPTDKSGGLGWFEADYLNYQDLSNTPATADGDFVRVMTNRFGGADLVAPSSTARPMLKTGVLNGLPACLFNGIDDVFSLTTVGTAVYTIALIAKFISTGAAQSVIDGGGTAEHLIQVGATPSSSALTAYAGASASTAATYDFTAAFFNLIVVFNGSSTVIRVNGTEETGLSAGTQTSTGLTVGQRFNASSPANVYVPVLLMYGADSNGTERNNIDGWMRAKYAAY